MSRKSANRRGPSQGRPKARHSLDTSQPKPPLTEAERASQAMIGSPLSEEEKHKRQEALRQASVDREN